MSQKLHDACGVFGMYTVGSADPVSSAYYALFALQHRGQHACGIAAARQDGSIVCHRQNGLVGDVFSNETLLSLGTDAHMAIGHCLYPSFQARREPTSQPLVVNHLKGSMAICFNGALTNASELRAELESKGAVFHTAGDAEVIAYTLIHARLDSHSIEDAVKAAMTRLKGAYSVVLMTRKKLVAFRDPVGFHPLVVGKNGENTVFASETCALDAVGASFVKDIHPGEIAIVDEDGLRYITAQTRERTGLCVFEYVYFARPDSVVDGTPVHIARQRAGAYLAKQAPTEADVVIGVPDSGIDAAIGYAMASGIPYGLGFIKNKYIGRTFIQPTQKSRENQVRIKLNPIAATVRGKRVILIDDSIVRGTTSAHIVGMLRDAGAKEIHMRISSPPFLNPCYFGTDIDSRDKLIASKHTIEEIAEIIGVDSLVYLSTENVGRLALETKTGLCKACFDGDYPAEIPADAEVSHE